MALAYLLVAPPVFLLGPLAGLLVLSRPRSGREVAWLAAASAWLVFWLRESGGVADQALRAVGVLAVGGFLALSLARPAPLFYRALAAAAAAFVALGVWCAAFHIEWDRLKGAIARELGHAFGQFARQAELAAGADAAEPFWRVADAARSWAALVPGVVFVQAVAGLVLGWTLYHTVARRPLGDPPQPFAAFRFSDQLVWLPVAGLALALLAPAGGWRDLGANLVIVAVAVYATRGLAVVRSGAGRVAAPAAAAAALAAFVFLPFIVGGLTLLGLADTWLDFRRRPATPTGGFDR
ncbi:MAG TPA: DUF2232 domain-containing protein [Gemmatimonadales bacterium]|nr:DUF2232 domain-containing protein [Gemmatimonadales bacterium]